MRALGSVVVGPRAAAQWGDVAAEASAAEASERFEGVDEQIGQGFDHHLEEERFHGGLSVPEARFWPHYGALAVF